MHGDGHHSAAQRVDGTPNPPVVLLSHQMHILCWHSGLHQTLVAVRRRLNLLCKLSQLSLFNVDGTTPSLQPLRWWRWSEVRRISWQTVMSNVRVSISQSTQRVACPTGLSCATHFIELCSRHRSQMWAVASCPGYKTLCQSVKLWPNLWGDSVSCKYAGSPKRRHLAERPGKQPITRWCPHHVLFRK